MRPTATAKPARFASKGSRAEEASSQIKDLILERGLKTGDPLPPESELQEILGVSRTSVREAVRTLSTLGIVEVRHGHGSFVGQMKLDALVETLVFRGVLSPGDDLQALREIVDVRLHLDLSQGEKLLGKLSGTANEELHELVNKMSELADNGEMFAEQDRKFHTSLLQLTENSLMVQLVGAFWDVHFAVSPKLGIPQPEDILHTVHAHADMLNALEAGNVDAYREAVIRHYQPLQRVLAEL